jgi:hypothetical protein
VAPFLAFIQQQCDPRVTSLTLDCPFQSHSGLVSAAWATWTVRPERPSSPRRRHQANTKQRPENVFSDLPNIDISARLVQIWTHRRG